MLCLDQPASPLERPEVRQVALKLDQHEFDLAVSFWYEIKDRGSQLILASNPVIAVAFFKECGVTWQVTVRSSVAADRML